MKLNHLVELKDQLTYSDTLGEHRFLELLREKCRNAHNVAHKVPFYFEDEGPDMLLVRPEAKEHKSQSWIDRMIKDMPGWNRYPSRRSCLKVYPHLHRVGSEAGNPYVVIPFDKARVGVCKGPSFYRSFEKACKRMRITKMDNGNLHNWLEMVIEATNALLDEKAEKLNADELETYADFERRLAKVDKVIGGRYAQMSKRMKEVEDLEDDSRAVFQDILDAHLTVGKYLERMVDPEHNDFEVMRIESVHKMPHDQELWVDAHCLLIKRKKYLQMHERGDLK